jgi:GNAT superfamily N-acetyltransferase
MIRPTIRMAQNSEAEDVRHILSVYGMCPEGHDWSEVYPFWLVAEYQGIIVGTIQVLPGKPFGFIGYWAVLPGYTNLGFGVFLWRAAERLLAGSGCDGWMGISAEEPVLKRVPEVGGIIYGEPVRVLFKRVYRPQEEKRIGTQGA